MKKYLVEVRRTGCGFRTIEIETEDEFKAADKALDIAGDYEFSEKDAHYEVDYVEEIDEITN